MAKGKRKRKGKGKHWDGPRRMGSLRQITAAVFHKTDLDEMAERDELGAAVVKELEAHVAKSLEEMQRSGVVRRVPNGWEATADPELLGQHLERIRDSHPEGVETRRRDLMERIAALRTDEREQGELAQELFLTQRELTQKLEGMLLEGSTSTDGERATLDDVFASDNGGAALALLRVIQPRLGLRDSEMDEPPAYLTGWREMESEDWGWFADNVIPAIRGTESQVLGLLLEAMLAHAQRTGVMKDVSMAVSGEGDAAKLIGMITDPETGKIIGVQPGTPASRLTHEQIAELAGLEWEQGTTYQPHAGDRMTAEDDVGQRVMDEAREQAVRDAADKGNPMAKRILEQIQEGVPPEEALASAGYHPVMHSVGSGEVDDSELRRLLGSMPDVSEDASDRRLRPWLRMWPEGEADGVRLYEGDPGLPVSYVGLSNLVAQGEAESFTARLSIQGLRQAIMPNAMHRVRGAWRCHQTDRTFVRLAMDVTMRDGKTLPVLHDVLGPTWEALRGDGPRVPANIYIHPGVENIDTFARGDFTAMPQDAERGDDMPIWAGARAFNGVWKACTQLAQIGHGAVQKGVDVVEFTKQTTLPKLLEELGGEDVSDAERDAILVHTRGKIGMAMTTLAGMRTATELLVDPDQIMALPDFDTWDGAINYAEQLHLPFEGVFLDLEGPAKACVVTETNRGGAVVVVRGAHVSRAVLGDNDSPLIVMPYGGAVMREQSDLARTYSPLGMFVFGEQPRGSGKVFAVQAALDGGYVHSHLACDPAYTLNDDAGMQLTKIAPPVAGSRCVAYTTHDAEPDMQLLQPRIDMAAATLTHAAFVALKALFLLDMSNVEIVTAPVSRQVRRQAERKGETIALSVHVHSNSKRYTERSGDGRHIEYSHRFRVRGHVKHYPIGTRMADARPDKCKPCPRCGTCRRIWTPPFVKGDPDKPLVLKSLVLDRDDAPVDDE